VAGYHHRIDTEGFALNTRNFATGHDASAGTRVVSLPGSFFLALLLVCIVLTSCGGSGSSNPSAPGVGSAPVITSFGANPGNISAGSSATLSWATSGASSITMLPGSFSSTDASGSTSVSPSATTIYTLTAMSASGSVTARATVSVNSAGSSGSLTVTTTACPGGTQDSAYAGCTLSVSGGTPPYTFSVSTNPNYPPLPEGMSLNASTGQISSAQIGGQGTYRLEFIVADAANTTPCRSHPEDDGRDGPRPQPEGSFCGWR